MSEYLEQALKFLDDCHATMEIQFIGTETNSHWNETEPRNKYHFIITTPLGKMEGNFWDSLHNTKITKMNSSDYAKKRFKCQYECLISYDKRKVVTELKQKKAEAKPNEYSILACLQKYDVGTMDDFMSDFGYEIHSAADIINFLYTYNGVCKEYQDLCRIFTSEQMDMLREIS